MNNVYNERIDKILSACGLLTRREAKDAAKCGRITVDGKKIKDSGQRITEKNKLCLDGTEVTYTNYVYVLLNKPKGYVCSTDERDGIPVLDIFKNKFGSRNVSPVGRLDKDTTGALLITDNGKLGHAMLSPKHHVEKKYICRTELPLKNEYIAQFAEGLAIGENEVTSPAMLSIIDDHTASLVITEGKFHQVKRMFQAVGNKITELHREEFASLTSPETEGEWRLLTESEIEQLFFLAGNI